MSHEVLRNVMLAVCISTVIIIEFFNIKKIRRSTKQVVEFKRAMQRLLADQNTYNIAYLSDLECMVTFESTNAIGVIIKFFKWDVKNEMLTENDAYGNHMSTLCCHPDLYWETVRGVRNGI